VPADGVLTLSLEGRADLPCLERVHDLVDELWGLVPEVELRDRYRFETAVIEVAGNIVEHGGPQVRLRLWLRVHPDAVEAQFRDTGRAVDLEAVGARTPDELAEDGRGLALARAAADDVTYERSGMTNRWRVLQRRTPATEHPIG
jgi:anti-sigma regulatory factor (Ser/Thr protein kinase)